MKKKLFFNGSVYFNKERIEISLSFADDNGVQDHHFFSTKESWKKDIVVILENARKGACACEK